MSIPKIPLFDVDWTLLKGGENNNIHHDAFDYALHTVFKQPKASFSDKPGEGRIDTQILIEILGLYGVSEERAKSKMPQAVKAMADYFMEHADEGHYEPMPGVVDLLNDLKQKGVSMGLLTGNVASIGWEKVKRAGIKDFFTFGVFGSMAYKRIDLIEIARKEASKVLELEVPTESLIIVGDSPLDIACARDSNIQVIASGAGNFKSHDLAHADLTVDSLEDQDKILEFLNIPPGGWSR